MTIFSDKKLKELYKLLDVPMIDFDCGDMCKEDNDGIPQCCDIEMTVPLLYLDEISYLNKNKIFWNKLKIETRVDKELAEGLDENDVLCICPSPSECERDRRAFVCRTFPFEPYLDDDGNLLGIVYQYSRADRCPLVNKPRSAYNNQYVKNSILFWEEIFKILPMEKDLFMEESKKLRNKFNKNNRKILVFK